MRSRVRNPAAAVRVDDVELERDEGPCMCRVCTVRPAWIANRLPVCEPCFDRVPSVEKMDFWHALEKSIYEPDVGAAVRAANARLVRAARNC